jgi:hypothetical protein
LNPEREELNTTLASCGHFAVIDIAASTKLQYAYTRSDGADTIIVVAIAITAYRPTVAMV